MNHDATKIILGTTDSSDKTVTAREGAIAAGLGARLKNDGSLSVAKADGSLLGVSLGEDLSDAKYCSIIHRGLAVPVLLASGVTPVLGGQAAVNDTTGEFGPVDTGYTGVNAKFVKIGMKGIKADGTEVDVALIDMEGGL